MSVCECGRAVKFSPSLNHLLISPRTNFISCGASERSTWKAFALGGEKKWSGAKVALAKLKFA